LAPIHVAIIPIYKGDEQLAKISEVANKLKAEMQAIGIIVKYDDDDKRKPGWKFAEYEMKGVPLRVAIGPRDLENGTVEVARRDTLEKESVQQVDLADKVQYLLEQIQINLLDRAKAYREKFTNVAATWNEFTELLDVKGGFVQAHWDGTEETEQKIKEETKATIRCIPFDQKVETGSCIYSGKPSKGMVLFAKAY
jgi:prolyl-tRNA synthetase